MLYIKALYVIFREKILLEIPAQSERSNFINLKLYRGLTTAMLFSVFWNLLALALPIYSMQIFDRVLPSGNLATLAALSMLMIILIVCSVLLDGSRTAILTRMAYRFDMQLYQRISAASLVLEARGAEALRDAETVKQFLSSPLAAALLDIPWSGVFVGAIFFLHPLLGWLTISATLLVIVVAVIGHVSTRQRRLDASSMTQDSYAILQAGRTNRTVLASMGMQSGVLERVTALRFAGLRSLSIANERQAWIDALGRGVRSAVQIAVLALAAVLVIDRDAQVGSIVATSMLFGRAIAPVERLVAGIHVLRGFREAWRRIAVILHTSQAATDRICLPELMGHLAVERLCFAVPGRSLPILNQVSFTVAPGKVLVIVGPEGAGKSVLAQLLVGAVQPTSGSVRLDGSSATDFDPCDIGRQTGFLPESVAFETMSVGQIIARGGVPDSAAVVAAAMLAGMHEAIQRFPAGYQTRVGTGHQFLSAGQQQRLALARALYRCPRYLVLDEPTAHLDDAGEAIVLRAVSEMKSRGSTIVIISRLPGLVHLADRLIMLEQGRLVLDQGQAGIQSYFKPRLASNN